MKPLVGIAVVEVHFRSPNQKSRTFGKPIQLGHPLASQEGGTPLGKVGAILKAGKAGLGDASRRAVHTEAQAKTE